MDGLVLDVRWKWTCAESVTILGCVVEHGYRMDAEPREDMMVGVSERA